MAKLVFFTKEKLGPKQSLTPEGFLLCEEVPLARLGIMVYGPDETPIEAGPDGIVKIYRDNAEEIFSAETIASAQGKPVTNEHPEDDVVPENWKELSVGIMLNVRRGEGIQDDLLLGDLLITTQEGIDAVREEGKTEVSLGYEAEYEQTGPGTGKQLNIVVNHVALVGNGRCGARCAIKDRNSLLKESDMRTKDSAAKIGLRSRIMDILNRARTADAAELEKIADEASEELNTGSDTHIHIHGATGDSEPEDKDKTKDEEEDKDKETKKTDDEDEEEDKDKTKDDDAKLWEQNAAEHAEIWAAIKALQSKAGTADEEMPDDVKDEIPEELQEAAAKAKDSAYFADTFQEAVGMAEILVPGIRIPTFDRSAAPVNTAKKIHTLRCQALDLAYHQPATRPILDDLLDGKALDTKSMTRDKARSLFKNAVATMRATNNSLGRVSQVKDTKAVSKEGPDKVTTLADLNRMNKKLYPESTGQ